MLTLTDLKPLLEATDEPVLSLYLLVDPTLQENQAATPAWHIWLKTTLRKIEDRIPDDQSDVWKAIRAKLAKLLSLYEPRDKTFVLFCGQNSQQIYELPVAIQNYAAFGEPALALLIRALDEYQPFLLTLVSHDSAQFFVVTFEEIQYQTEIELLVSREQWREYTLMPATAAGGYVRAGSHRNRFSSRIDAQVDRFYQEVAEEVMDLGRIFDVDRIVLAGNEEAAHAVRDHMEGRTVIGPIPIAHYLKPIEIVEQVTPLVLESRLEDDLTLIQEIVQLAESGGRAALGRVVFDALEQGTVELLMLPWTSANEQFVDKVTLEAMRAGAQVKLVRGAAAEYLIRECGIAARLYYRQPTR